jgi:hypothetical protein
MTFIKALLLPLAVCVALLVPEYELWCLDENWSGAPDEAVSLPTIGSRGQSEIVLNGCTRLLWSVITPGTPGDDDDADDDDD